MTHCFVASWWKRVFTIIIQILLTSLVVVRNKQLFQAPPWWRHNTIPWWRPIQNITSSWNLQFVGNVKRRQHHGQILIEFYCFDIMGKMKLHSFVTRFTKPPSGIKIWRTVSRNNTFYYFIKLDELDLCFKHQHRKGLLSTTRLIHARLFFTRGEEDEPC